MTTTAHATAPHAAVLTSLDVPRPEIELEPRPTFGRVLVGAFVAVPLLALIAAVPLAWGWGLGWHDVIIAIAFYYISGLGIAVGLHRYFTHRSFKAVRGFKIALAVAGSLAIEGPVITWVADHRRHHKYSDKAGDPHSPWRFGNDWQALSKGLAFAHVGWLFDGDVTSEEKFCPDWLADSDVLRISRWFPGLVAVSLLAPALIGGLWSMSWQGAVTAFFWATLVRIAFLHHITWSINSICHTFGKEEFKVRDKSRNVSWLAILSFGESWHNLHHADPPSADPGPRALVEQQQLGPAGQHRDQSGLLPVAMGLTMNTAGPGNGPRIAPVRLLLWPGRVVIIGHFPLPPRAHHAITFEPLRRGRKATLD